MDAYAQLADLLAGDLDADERAALEAELARDPELRAGLESMRRADHGLAALAAARPSQGFERRLDAAVAASLQDVLDGSEASATPATPATPATADSSSGSTSTASGPAVADSLAARRVQRAERRSRVLQSLVGVAAASVVLVGGGVFLSQVGGGEDAGERSVETFAADEPAQEGVAGTENPSDGGAALQLESSEAAGPTVVAEDRDLDDAAIDELLTGGELDAVRSQALEGADARDTAERFRAALGAPSAAPEEPAESTEEMADAPAAESEASPESEESDRESADDAAATSDAATAIPPTPVTRDGTLLPSVDAEDLARCLDVLLTQQADAIPVYAELGSHAGADVVVFGLVALDPSTGAYTAGQVWALDRSDCAVLNVSPAGAG